MIVLEFYYLVFFSGLVKKLDGKWNLVVIGIKGIEVMLYETVLGKFEFVISFGFSLFLFRVDGYKINFF